MKNIAKKMIRILNLYRTMFNARDPQLYVFGSWWGEKFADNSKFLYLYAVKKGLNAWWITSNKTIYDELMAKNLPVALMNSKEGIRLCKTAGYYIYSTALKDISDTYCGGATLINLWHGIPLKKIMYDNKLNNGDYTFKGRLSNILTAIPTKNKYVVSTSEEVSKIYQFAFKCDRKFVLNWGQPRNDCFFDGAIKRRSYYDSNGKRIVLYMPTHRNEGATKIDIFKIFNLKELNETCRAHDVIFLIKKHFYHKYETVDLTEFSNIYDCTQENYDTQELLFNADILVTDYSSCFIDYLLLDRPIMFYAYDYNEYLKNDREMYFDLTKIAPGSISYDFGEFIADLSVALADSDHNNERRERIRNVFYDKQNQGIVSDKIIYRLTHGLIK